MSVDPEYRTGSADSAGSEGTGSDDFVQVGPEDALAAEQQDLKGREPELVSGSGMADFGSDEYMYGDGGEEEEEEEGEEGEEGEGGDEGGEAVDSKPPGHPEEPPPLPVDQPISPLEADPHLMESKETEETREVPPIPDRESAPWHPAGSGGVEDVLPPPSSVKEPEPSTEEREAPPTEAETSPKAPCIEARGFLSFLNFLHPVVLYIIYWRDWKLSAVVLGVCLVVLLTLTLNTFLHTLVLLLLSFMVVSLTYIVTKISIDTFYNKEVKNPFGDYLNKRICLPEEKILEWTQYGVERADRYFNILVRLLLFDNIKSSLKFGVSLWLLSFVTNYFTVLSTLLFLLVLLFSIPPAYNQFQPMVDSHICKVWSKVEEVYSKVLARVPFLPKSKAE